jgi:hypothetical protein
VAPETTVALLEVDLGAVVVVVVDLVVEELLPESELDELDPDVVDVVPSDADEIDLFDLDDPEATEVEVDLDTTAVEAEAPGISWDIATPKTAAVRAAPPVAAPVTRLTFLNAAALRTPGLLLDI